MHSVSRHTHTLEKDVLIIKTMFVLCFLHIMYHFVLNKYDNTN